MYTLYITYYFNSSYSLAKNSKLDAELEEMKRKLELNNLNYENAIKKIENDKETLKNTLEEEKNSIIQEKNAIIKEKRELEKLIENNSNETNEKNSNFEKESGKFQSNINRITKLLTDKTEELGIVILKYVIEIYSLFNI
jgi:hypothetical protein